MSEREPEAPEMRVEMPEVEDAGGIRVSKGAIQTTVAFLTIFAFVLGVAGGVVNWVRTNSLDIARMEWRVAELEKKNEAAVAAEAEKGKRLDEINASLIEMRTTLKELMLRNHSGR